MPDPWKVKIDNTDPTSSNYGVFHSSLLGNMVNVGTNAELTITLRVQLVPIKTMSDYLSFLPPKVKQFIKFQSTYPDYDSKTAGSPEIPIQPWEPLAWKKWMQDYKTQGEKAWHGKFWLEPPKTWSKFDFEGPGKKTYRANVWCRFILDVRDSKFDEGAHKVITVVNLLDKKKFFRSDDSSYDDQDLTPVDKGGGLMQVGAIHEIGHALGMDHISNLLDPTKCPVGSGDSVCYGTSPKERVNIMGSGMKVQKVNALPWVERIANHTSTNKSDWKVHTDWIRPKPHHS